MQIRKAQRKAVKLKLALTGISGAGKTLGSILLASGIVGKTGKILVIDTENARSDFYADYHLTSGIDFNVLPLEAPYTIPKYLAALDIGMKDGYDIIIMDSISHEWDGSGGVLDQKNVIDARGGNSFTNWNKFTPDHNKFLAAIISCNCHIICTMRRKTDRAMSDNGGGKSKVTTMGLKVVQREGIEYEFDTIFDINKDDNKFSVEKDRTGMFNGRIELITTKTGEEFRDWLKSAKPADPYIAKPTVDTTDAQDEPKRATAASQLITLDQETEISDLATESKANVDGFLKAYNVSCYAHLTQEQYLSAKRKLKQKIEDAKGTAS